MSYSPFYSFTACRNRQALGLAVGVWAVCTDPLPNSHRYIVPQIIFICKILNAHKLGKIAEISGFSFEK
jgi:hypothetical protein